LIASYRQSHEIIIVFLSCLGNLFDLRFNSFALKFILDLLGVDQRSTPEDIVFRSLLTL
jgi:hypothetical protein